MPESSQDRENPYASPRSLGEGPAQPDLDDHLDVFPIEPWIRPRSVVDVFANIAVVLVAVMVAAVIVGSGFVVIGACAAACAWLGLRAAPPLIMVLGALVWGGMVVVAGIAVRILEPRYKVKRVWIDAAGIGFERTIGKPRSLKWQDVRLIRPASRGEVFVYGWLWLPPTREPTNTVSITGHFRIEWAGGYLYFPPENPELFEKAIGKFCPGALQMT